MSEAPTGGSEILDDAKDGDVDDDFLYFLYQGGELLQMGRVVEAKEQLEKAFALKPLNPRGQNLLGLVHFKLGQFDRAAEIYRNLVQRFPNDVTLRVNLAMVYFKAGMLEEAEDALRRALDFDPEHEKGHRYLGLVLMKKGDREQAWQHFSKAGVGDIQRFLGSQSQELGPSELPAAGGSAISPEVAAPAAPAQIFSVSGSTLVARVSGRLYARLASAVWVEGEVSFDSVNKRFAGEETRHPFDLAERAMMVVTGEGSIKFSVDEGEFLLLDHGAKAGFFVEDLVFAFGDTISWENGRVTGTQGTELAVFHLFELAQLVLCCKGAVRKRQLDGSRRFLLKASQLVGWTGSLVPKLIAGAPPLAGGAWVDFSGTGEVFSLA